MVESINLNEYLLVTLDYIQILSDTRLLYVQKRTTQILEVLKFITSCQTHDKFAYYCYYVTF